MGYHTDFMGEFTINEPVNDEVAALLRRLQQTRRMKRNNQLLIEAGFGDCGEDGEFFCLDDGNYGQNSHPASIVNYNQPPATQPGLWCQWELQEDNQTIEWDGQERFYNYVEWIQYLIDKVLAPNHYTVERLVVYRGEDFEDFGSIHISNNQVQENYQNFGDFFE